MEFKFNLGEIFNAEIIYKVYLVDPNGAPFERKDSGSHAVSVRKNQEYGICFERIVHGKSSIKEYPTVFSAIISIDGVELPELCLPRASGRTVLLTEPGNNNGELFRIKDAEKESVIQIQLTPQKRPATFAHIADLKTDLMQSQSLLNKAVAAFNDAANHGTNPQTGRSGEFFYAVPFIPDDGRQQVGSLRIIADVSDANEIIILEGRDMSDIPLELPEQQL